MSVSNTTILKEKVRIKLFTVINSLYEWHNHCSIKITAKFLSETNTSVRMFYLEIIEKEILMLKKTVLMLGMGLFLLSGIFATGFTTETVNFRPEPTVSPSVSPTARPSLLDTPTPTPTVSPSPSPSATVSPSPSPNPTTSPSPNPSPTGEPTPFTNPTVAPIPNPTVSPTP